ncbi:hypothetical protein HDU96_010908 [Phlyctochytrium bullatum]|nr:hypothetical protein HDU96_010908 [Phlyctochytrium bullatum]
MDGAIVSMDDFEHAKENIEPLARGRSAKTLAMLYGDGSTSHPTFSSRSSSKPTADPTPEPSSADDAAAGAELRKEAKEERRRLEKAISRSSMDDDDPLDPHHRLLMWYQSHHPSGHAEYFKLLERAARGFRKDPRYKNDLRYVRIWLEVAAKNNIPDDVFKYLLNNLIGETCAVFYEEYAAYLETVEKQEADDIFQLGINRKALPLERLQRKHEAFRQRWDDRKRQAEQDPFYLPGASISTPSSAPPPTQARTIVRSVLGVDRPPARGESARSIVAQTVSLPGPKPARPAAASQPPPARSGSSSNRGNSKMKIFQDAEGELPGAVAQSAREAEITIGAARTKENRVQSAPWKATTIPQDEGAAYRPKGERIEVYCDEDEESQPERTLEGDAAKNVLVSKPSKSVDQDLLKHCVTDEPERAPRAPQPSKDSASAPPPQAAARPASAPATAVAPKEVTVGGSRTAKPMVKPSVNERFAWSMDRILKGKEEFSFEEVRAKEPKYVVDLFRAAERGRAGKQTERKEAVKGVPEPEVREVKKAVMESRPVEKEAPIVKQAHTVSAPQAPDARPTVKPLKSALVNRPAAAGPSSEVISQFELAAQKAEASLIDDDDEDDDDDADRRDLSRLAGVGGHKFGRTIVPVKATGFMAKKAGIGSPTINTKAALADVLDMFNAPLASEQEEVGTGGLGDAGIEVEVDETVSSKVFRRVDGEAKIGVFSDVEGVSGGDFRDNGIEVEVDETVSSKVFKRVEGEAKIGVFSDAEGVLENSNASFRGPKSKMPVFSDENEAPGAPAMKVFADENEVVRSRSFREEVDGRSRSRIFSDENDVPVAAAKKMQVFSDENEPEMSGLRAAKPKMSIFADENDAAAGLHATGSSSFRVFSDENEPSRAAKKEGTGLRDKSFGEASKLHVFADEDEPPRASSRAFPVFSDREVKAEPRLESSRSFHVFREEGAAKRGIEQKSKSFHVFEDENDEEPPKERSRSFRIFADELDLRERSVGRVEGVGRNESFAAEEGKSFHSVLNRSLVDKDSKPLLDFDSPFLEVSPKPSVVGNSSKLLSSRVEVYAEEDETARLCRETLKRDELAFDPNASLIEFSSRSIQERLDAATSNVGGAVWDDTSKPFVAPAVEPLVTIPPLPASLGTLSGFGVDDDDGVSLPREEETKPAEADSSGSFGFSFDASSGRPSFGKGGFGRGLYRDVMTPITEVSFEGGDRTIAGISTIDGATRRFRYLSGGTLPRTASRRSGVRDIGEEEEEEDGGRRGSGGRAGGNDASGCGSGRESLDGASCLTLSDHTISSISIVNSGTDLSLNDIPFPSEQSPPLQAGGAAESRAISEPTGHAQPEVAGRVGEAEVEALVRVEEEVPEFY